MVRSHYRQTVKLSDFVSHPHVCIKGIFRHIPEDLHLIDTGIAGHDVFDVRRESAAGHMGPEIPLRHAAVAAVIVFVFDPAYGAVGIDAQHRHLSVVVSGNADIFIVRADAQMAAPEAVDLYAIKPLQRSVWQDPESHHAFIRDGIEPVQRMGIDHI